MCKFPETQRLTRAAVDSVGEVAVEDGAGLLRALRGSYLEGLVNESMRLASPGNIGMRKVKHAVTVPASLTGSEAVVLQPGTSVVVDHSSEHLDPSQFPDPWR